MKHVPQEDEVDSYGPLPPANANQPEQSGECKDTMHARLQPDRTHAERFLTKLDDCAETFTFQTFDDNADRRDPSLAQVINGTLDDVWEKLERLNNAGAGVFVTVNETDLRGRKTKNITRIRAVWQEADRSGSPSLPVEPHIEVESSPGKYHRYILNDNASLDEFEPVQNRLVQDYGSDPNAKDRARVLRVPGFYHQKVNTRKGLNGAPHLVTITFESREQALSWERVKTLFPPLKENVNISKPKGAPKPLTDFDEVATALHAIDPDCDYPTWLQIGMALHSTGAGEQAFILWDEWSANGTSYRAGECAYKWNSFHADGGITLKTLFKHAQDAGWINSAKPTGFVDTDLVNGERFARMHGDRAFYTPERGWLIWDGKRWRVDEHHHVMALAKQTARKIFSEIEHVPQHEKDLFKWARQSQSKERLYAMLELAKSEPGIPESLTRFDADPFVLNCWNGILDLRTGELTPHDPKRKLSKITSVEYRPSALCPLWLKFLDRIMGGNKEMIEFLQRAVGYTLTGDTGEQCLFFSFGSGANGKSVFLETLMILLGEYATNSRAETIMLKTYGSGIPNDVARLVGMRFVAISETEQGQRMAESQIKDMTGGDRVTARFLRKEFFDFKPEFKLWIRGNHKPRITGTDDGIWRRIHLVPFEVQIPAAERDGNLADKLRDELPGILAWAVEGARKWAETGLRIPDKVRVATTEYRDDMDRLADFISERCVTGSAHSIYAGELYNHYKVWCGTSGDSPMSQTAFGLALGERGFCKRKVAGRKKYEGIGLSVGIHKGWASE